MTQGHPTSGDTPRPVPPISAQEREQWLGAAHALASVMEHVTVVEFNPLAVMICSDDPTQTGPELLNYVRAAVVAFPRLLAENTTLWLEAAGWRMDAAAAHSEAADWREAAGELTAERDAARDEVAGYRAQVQAMRERWAMEHDGTILQSGATQPPLPDPPDPTAPQQLGLLEDGA